MSLDLQKFSVACSPGRPLIIANSDDRKYYIDFASVRGGKIIENLKRTIVRLQPDQPTRQLFTGHIGCGKSTELRRLEFELQQEGFHVIYFEATQELDTANIDISDILLVIARQVSSSLEKLNVELHPRGFKALLKEAADLLQTPIELSGEANLLGMGTLKASTQGEVEFSLPGGIGTLTAKTKSNPKMREQLRQYLEPRTNAILQAINEEILKPAIEQLKKQGKKGLVVLVDNLDRIDTRPVLAGRPLSEYIFVQRGEELGKLHCHVVYTIPLELIFSNESEALTNRLGGGVPPKVLPMVPVQLKDGSESQEGMELLRKLVLTRAFPNVEPEQRMGLVKEVFDSQETLDRLCRVSGGHMRNLLGMLLRCLQEQDPPFPRSCVEKVIRESANTMLLPITSDEWELLRQLVKERRTVTGETEYQTLLRSLFVFEYRDQQGEIWFDINPILKESGKI